MQRRRILNEFCRIDQLCIKAVVARGHFIRCVGVVGRLSHHRLTIQTRADQIATVKPHQFILRLSALGSRPHHEAHSAGQRRGLDGDLQTGKPLVCEDPLHPPRQIPRRDVFEVMQPHHIVATLQSEIQAAENAVLVQPGPSRAVADVNNGELLVGVYWPVEIVAAVLADDRLALGMITQLRVQGWDRLGCRIF